MVGRKKKSIKRIYLPESIYIDKSVYRTEIKDAYPIEIGREPSERRENGREFAFGYGKVIHFRL